VSGAGDVRAGLVAGLLARGAEPAQAAVWAGHLHARAGERLTAQLGPLGYLARELAPQVPSLLVELAH
jgi:NAD(P)H-hydrate repair Nnr-like enzyme with NAD(P)H-hydrate dehydratase domain